MSLGVVIRGPEGSDTERRLANMRVTLHPKGTPEEESITCGRYLDTLGPLTSEFDAVHLASQECAGSNRGITQNMNAATNTRVSIAKQAEEDRL